MPTPPFIVLEGPDGSGTTKHVELLVARLQKLHKPVLGTAEPTGGPIGRHIREFLSSGELAADALQLLFTADRADHVRRSIEPSLAAGTCVISDRYVHSTIAYGQALGLPSSWLKSMNTNFVQPSCVIFALPTFEVCQERLGRRATKDTLEGAELQRKVYDCYAMLAQEDPTIHVVDTSGEKEAVHEVMWNIVAPLFPH